jgi:hypothetical protein
MMVFDPSRLPLTLTCFLKLRGMAKVYAPIKGFAELHAWLVHCEGEFYETLSSFFPML